MYLLGRWSAGHLLRDQVLRERPRCIHAWGDLSVGFLYRAVITLQWGRALQRGVLFLVGAATNSFAELYKQVARISGSSAPSGPALKSFYG
jgi:hypothetical protein